VGLATVGVDAVGIGNNHLYDALATGVDQTLAALDTAGFAAGSGRAGGGRTQAEAWAPAMMDAGGSKVALIACTTIDGHLVTPTYVAQGEAKGGAAACSDSGITTAVQAARRTADLVIVMIHGGYEYDRSPTPNIAHLSAVARDAGAALVVDHHPHVIGGFDRAVDSLTAWTFGNLLFDQLVWPTYESYLLTVHVRDGKIIRAIADPLMIDGFQPVGLVGDLAAHVARDAAGWAPGPFVVEDGAVEVSDPERIARTRLAVDLVGADAGTIMRLPGSTTVDPGPSGGTIEAGRDLLWTGEFEKELAGHDGGGASLWDLPSQDSSRSSAAAHTGGGGIRIRRTGASNGDAVLQPVHRIPVTSGTKLTFLASIRADGGAESLIDLRWFNDLAGSSQSRTTLSLGAAGTDGWREVRIDMIVPPNAVAILPQVRLAAPAAGAVNVDIDDVRLIEWAPLSNATLATDHLRVRGDVHLELLVAFLAGGDATPGQPIIREAPWRTLRADVAALPAPAERPVDREGGD
jgi:poly-gamma-glutamate synthesis protein (capsule biosynthesis protein)